jgi:hypothetical protein
LAGFDMVYAITQNTVNSQLAWLHRSGVIPKGVQIGDLAGDGMAIGAAGAAATIAAPTVDFDTGSPRTARMIIAFTGGDISYYKGFGPSATVATQPLKGWKIAFNVNLNLGQIAHEHLANSAAIPKEISDILSKFDPSMFSVQSIFMDFQNSDLANYDPLNSAMNTDDAFLRQTFATHMGAWLKRQQGANQPFILGYPVTRKAPPADVKSVFEPTGANLSVHAFENPVGATTRQPGLSTLNFLLVTGNRKITDEPRLFSGDAGSFHHNLVADNAVDGRAIIARKLFTSTYLYPLIVKPLQDRLHQQGDYVNARRDRGAGAEINDKSAPDRSHLATFVETPTGWIYHDHVKLGWHESGFYSHDRESEQEVTFTVDILTRKDQHGAPRLTVDIRSKLYRYEWDQQNTDVPPFKSNVYVGKGWASATLTWEMTLMFVAGADGKISIIKNSTVAPPAKDHGDAGAYKIADFFSNLLNLHGISDNWRDNAVGLGNVETSVVNAFIGATGPILDGAMTHVVLPGASQFFYKNIQLNAAGDVEVDLAYKSEG